MSLGGAVTHWAGAGLAPLLPFWLRLRAGRGKEIPERLAERRGAGAERPEGPLLWLHAASVGESLSLLPLMAALMERRPALRLLVTTGTVTAATLLAQRLPPDLAGRVTHRFVPLDVPRWAEAFLDGWRPDGAIFVESELWPNMTAALARRGIPAVLVNARMSPRSARMWRWAPGLAREILSRFRLIFTQTEEDAARLRALGAGAVQSWGNLKAAAEPLPADPVELRRLCALLGGRPVFLAASTQPGEEAVVLEAAGLARANLPELLTIIAPRHPERGAEVAALAAGTVGEAAVSRRAAGGQPGPGCRCMWPTRWASWGCSSAWRGWPSSAPRWCPRAGTIRWSRRGSAAPSCSARTPSMWRRWPARWRPPAAPSGWRMAPRWPRR
ncbi:3-deoxy-D-manno-octulosonic acid transferase [Teichococcus aestuarii]|uniref:3-deoxy-D-manno-octulosonic acid transferase n=1 Tax=Teichococcus aestuarii TaxID=568898 RepID=UPI00360F9CF4